MIEILITVLIVSFIGGVIYSAFSQGVRIWHLAGRNTAELNLDVFFEKITTEVHNAFLVSPSVFSGEADSVAFHSLKIDQSRSGSNIPNPVFIKYRFDRYKNLIEKNEAEYLHSLNLASTQTNQSGAVATHIADCSFEYYAYDIAARTYSWKKNWQEKCLPLALRIKVDYKDMAQTRNLNRVVMIPSSGRCEG